MKKYIFGIAIMIFSLILFVPSLAYDESFAFDYADLFYDDEEVMLADLSAEMTGLYNTDVVLLTSYESYDDSVAYAEYFYYEYIADNSYNDLVFIFFIDMYNRVPTVYWYGEIGNYIDNNRRDKLLDIGYDDLSAGDYASAAEKTLLLLDTYINEGVVYNGSDGNEGKNYLIPSAIAVGAAALVGLCYYFINSHAYSLKSSTYSYDYNKNSELNLEVSRDSYIRTEVVRRQKPKDNNSNSKSGSSSSGGGSGKKF